MKEKIGKKLKILWEDGKYYIPSWKNMKEIIEKTHVERKKYLINRFDCQNFAGYFKNYVALKFHINNVGRVLNYEGMHSFNLLLLKKGFKVFEPQVDSWWSMKENKEKGKDYKIKGQILLV